MNRLKNHTCYLVGSMDDGRQEGKHWRAMMEEFLESRGVTVLNPYHKPLRSDTHSSELLEDDDNHEKVMAALRNENYDEVRRRFKQVRAVDLRLVDKSDFIVAYLDFSKIMTGTMEEIFTANRQRKPVIICSSLPKNQMPPWYFGAFPHEVFFENWTDVKLYLHEIDTEPVLKDLLGNRWVFFEPAEV